MNKKILFVSKDKTADVYDFSDVFGMEEVVREIFVNHKCIKCTNDIEFFNSRYELKWSKELIAYIKKRLVTVYAKKYPSFDYSEVFPILDALDENYTLHYIYKQSFYKVL